MTKHDTFFADTEVAPTTLLSEAPEDFMVKQPAMAGPHVIRRRVSYGGYTITHYSLGSWPSKHDKVWHEFVIDGGHLPDLNFKVSYKHLLVVTTPGSNLAHIVCPEGRITYLGSFQSVEQAKRRLQQELVNKSVADKP